MNDPLTERDLDLIEVALESAAQAVQSGATLRDLGRKRGLDPLAREYLTAWHHIEALRKVREGAP